ncbi:hypothetical protein KAR91_05955 [Candidatus Pacearchaeota archaeon]|nr:hypothetical protein [Candidatus Pacearchaeota archaeon]
MKDQNKYYRKVLSKNADHIRGLIDFFQTMFQMVKKWTMVDYVPKARLLATLRVYVDKDGTHYIRLGNHSSHTSGCWFKQEG